MLEATEDQAFATSLYGTLSDSDDDDLSEIVIKYDSYSRIVPCVSNQPESLNLALVKRYFDFTIFIICESN